jgi:hypothetical protein
MVRVAGLIGQLRSGGERPSPGRSHDSGTADPD